MATVDFTLEDLRNVIREETTDVVRREMIAERAYTKQMIEDSANGIRTEIKTMRKMLEEDILAESQRLTKVDRRLEKTTRLLMAHIADTSAHGGKKATA